MTTTQQNLKPLTSVKKDVQKPILTKRQKECLALAALGLTAHTIANKLGITERMVRKHLAAARYRLKAHSTTEAVYSALKLHILD